MNSLSKLVKILLHIVIATLPGFTTAVVIVSKTLHRLVVTAKDQNIEGQYIDVNCIVRKLKRKLTWSPTQKSCNQRHSLRGEKCHYEAGGRHRVSGYSCSSTDSSSGEQQQSRAFVEILFLVLMIPNYLSTISNQSHI